MCHTSALRVSLKLVWGRQATSQIEEIPRVTPTGFLKERERKMRRRDVASAAAQAGIMGALAAWLTVSFTNPLGLEWATRDSAFVLAVMAAVFYSRIKSMKLEQVINAEHHKLLAHGEVTCERYCGDLDGAKGADVVHFVAAHPLERLEYVHGEPVQIEPNKITCLLFFVRAIGLHKLPFGSLKHDGVHTSAILDRNLSSHRRNWTGIVVRQVSRSAATARASAR